MTETKSRHLLVMLAKVPDFRKALNNPEWLCCDVDKTKQIWYYDGVLRLWNVRDYYGE